MRIFITILLILTSATSVFASVAMNPIRAFVPNSFILFGYAILLLFPILTCFRKLWRTGCILTGITFLYMTIWNIQRIINCLWIPSLWILCLFFGSIIPLLVIFIQRKKKIITPQENRSKMMYWGLTGGIMFVVLIISSIFTEIFYTSNCPLF